MKRKGQAALEFLTTYGWAFLVILVMIGALAYFGVLDPSRFVSDSCQIGGAHFRCDEANIVTNTLNLKIVNSQTDMINITNVNVTDPRSGSSVAHTTAETISGSQIETVAVDVTGLSLTTNDKVRLDVQVTYKKGTGGLQQKVVGSVIATVQ